MQPKENLIGIVRALYNKRKRIILISILAGILTAGISLLLPNWYQGTTIFYVASPDLGIPSPLGLSNDRIRYYGEGEDIDRILTIAESNHLASDLINHFDLMSHYEIDSSNRKAPIKVLTKFKSNFDVKKTQYEALSLSFESTNPILARDVTNVAREKINVRAQQLIKDAQEKQLLTFQNDINEKRGFLADLNARIDSIKMKYDIYDTRQQGQIIAELITTNKSKLDNYEAKIDLYKNIRGYRDSVKYFEASVGALSHQISKLKESANNYTKGISALKALQEQSEGASTQLAYDLERYKLLKSKYESPFDAIHVIENADLPIVKSRPKRSIIVIMAVLFTFVIMCFITIVLEFYKEIDWKTVFND